MQNLVCEVSNQSKTSSTKRERIVWEKGGGDDKSKKIVVRTSNFDRSVQVIQEEKNTRQVQSGQKNEVFFTLIVTHTIISDFKF
jgi:hypothetical protein